MKYTFRIVDKCNMCGSTSFKIMGKRLNKSQGKNPRKKTGITTTILKCKNCGLIFPNPLPIPENIEQHYGINPEQYWKESYFKIDKNYFKSQINTFYKLYNALDNNITALDIGAGIGKCMISLENSNIIAYGIEPSEQFYEFAISKMNISRNKIKNESIENADFKNIQFDFISFGAVLEHLINPSHAIKKAINWLKPNGLIYIEAPSSKWLTNKIFNLFYKIQGLDYVANISPMHLPFHLYEFGLDSFNINGVLNGYKTEFYKYHVASTFLPKIIGPIIKPIMKKTNTGLQLEIWLRKS
ncbi:MAG: class I SAM-dependent methyltransferase [Bacteroidales bacterium]|nr:class I SAM-dependent methyltransferase [Bacteroidales bacterium]